MGDTEIVNVTKLLSLIRDAGRRKLEVNFTHRPLTLEIGIGDQLYEIGANRIRHHYLQKIPPLETAEVRNGWICQTLSLDELEAQLAAETTIIIRMWADDLQQALKSSES